MNSKVRLFRNNIIAVAVGIGTFLAPHIVRADPPTLRDIIVKITSLIQLASILLGGLLVVAFVWGIARFILNVGGSDKRAADKQYLFWVVVAMFVMFGVVGLVTILQNTLLNG